MTLADVNRELRVMFEAFHLDHTEAGILALPEMRPDIGVLLELDLETLATARVYDSTSGEHLPSVPTILRDEDAPPSRPSFPPSASPPDPALTGNGRDSHE